MFKNCLHLIACILLLQGCIGTQRATDIDTRILAAKGIAQHAGMKEKVLSTENFSFLSFTGSQTNTDTLTIYIEGDGHAWDNTRTPSSDPTPVTPIALELSARDYSHGVAYLARPCQYLKITKSAGCDSQKQWTSARFSPLILRNTSDAIDQLKHQFRSNRIVLVGFSGGATLALLLAASRQDVAQVISVAGNLDTEAWSHYHHLSPLEGSLNPADYSPILQRIRQTLLIGRMDEVTPPTLTQTYLSHFQDRSLIQAIYFEGFTHNCCWTNNWGGLINQFRINIIR